MNKKPEFYECGICNCYHSAQWDGDCREDAARFTPDDLDRQFQPDGWIKVDMPLGDVEKRFNAEDQPHQSHRQS